MWMKIEEKWELRRVDPGCSIQQFSFGEVDGNSETQILRSSGNFRVYLKCEDTKIYHCITISARKVFALCPMAASRSNSVSPARPPAFAGKKVCPFDQALESCLGGSAGAR